jgi:hypothetical protein
MAKTNKQTEAKTEAAVEPPQPTKRDLFNAALDKVYAMQDELRAAKDKVQDIEKKLAEARQRLKAMFGDLGLDLAPTNEEKTTRKPRTKSKQLTDEDKQLVDKVRSALPSEFLPSEFEVEAKKQGLACPFADIRKAKLVKGNKGRSGKYTWV